MKWNNLLQKPSKKRSRVGRGIGSGSGKTSGRGTKGQSSRSGGKRRPGFEGGQTPLHMRLPKKRGFNSKRAAAQIIHTDQLGSFKTGAKVDIQVLKAAGMVSSLKQPVRLVSRGKLEKKLNVSLQGGSKDAQAVITKAGGTFTVTALPKVREPKTVKA